MIHVSVNYFDIYYFVIYLSNHLVPMEVPKSMLTQIVQLPSMHKRELIIFSNPRNQK